MTKSDVEFMSNLYHICARYSSGAGTMTPDMAKANNPPAFIRSPEAQAKLKAEMAACKGACCKPRERI
jgi:hypothetical protein